MTAVSAPLAASSAPSLRARTALALALIGAVGAVIGALLPWTTVFAGLTTIPGFQLDGGPLAAVAVAAAAVLAMLSHRGGPRWLRIVAALGALTVLADALISAQRIAALVAHPGPAGALLKPTLGPGPFVTAAGGLLLLTAALTLPVVTRPLGRALLGRLALITLLSGAGTIHLLLTPEHLGESPLLGTGFLAAGLAQLALAAVLAVRPSGLALSGTIAVNLALAALYLEAVFIGLPLEGGHDAHAAGLILGAGEPVDLAGAVDLLLEVAAIALAIVLPRSAAADRP